MFDRPEQGIHLLFLFVTSRSGVSHTVQRRTKFVIGRHRCMASDSLLTVKAHIVVVLRSVPGFIAAAMRRAVVYEYRCVAGYHIVRVDVGDGEVEHVLGVDGGLYGGDVEVLAGGGVELGAGL